MDDIDIDDDNINSQENIKRLEKRMNTISNANNNINNNNNNINNVNVNGNGILYPTLNNNNNNNNNSNKGNINGNGNGIHMNGAGEGRDKIELKHAPPSPTTATIVQNVNATRQTLQSFHLDTTLANIHLNPTPFLPSRDDSTIKMGNGNTSSKTETTTTTTTTIKQHSRNPSSPPTISIDKISTTNISNSANNSNNSSTNNSPRSSSTGNSPRKNTKDGVSIYENGESTDVSMVENKDATLLQQKNTRWFSSIKNSITNINTKIKQLFISPDTEEAFEHINALFSKFFQDVKHSKVDLFLGLLLLDSYYKNSHISSGERVEDREFIKRASHFMRFASASFGSKYVYSYRYSAGTAWGFIQGVSGTDAMNINSLCEYTGVAKEDVINYRFTSTNFDPGHYIAIDHKFKSIVFSIRGTFHPRDVLTDLVATNAPFLDGHAHTGILRSAQKKYSELSPILLQQHEKYPQYTIIVVGHSLGAGTAALFTLIFNDEHPNVPIHCYAFAPPCVTSLEIALTTKCKQLITTFVLNNDIIPRLSYQSLDHLKTLVGSILENNTKFVQRSFQILTAGNNLGDDLTNKIAGYLKVSREVKIDYSHKVTLSSMTMLPPGNIYRMYKLTSMSRDYVMELSSPSLFGEIIISGTLLSDHLPDNYEVAFDSCLKLLNDITPSSEAEILNDFIAIDNYVDTKDGQEINNDNSQDTCKTTTTTTNTIKNTTTTLSSPSSPILNNDKQQLLVDVSYDEDVNNNTNSNVNQDIHEMNDSLIKESVEITSRVILS